MDAFASLNLSAGVNPIPGDPGEGQPMTPVFYDPYNQRYAESGPPIFLGTGTKYQLPTKSLAHCCVAGWQWLGGTLKVDLRVTPQMTDGTSSGSGVTCEDPIDLSIYCEIGRQDTPVYPDTPPAGQNPWPKPWTVPGPDLTLGTKYPFNRTYNAWTDDTKDPNNPTYNTPAFTPQYFQFATYTDLSASSGIDTVFIYPVVRVSLGIFPFFTHNVNEDADDREDFIIYYWNDDFEVTITWGLAASGPGLPDADPPIPPIPLGPIGEFPPTDGINAALPQILTTIFDIDRFTQDGDQLTFEETYSNEYDVIVNDAVINRVESKNPKIRSLAPGGAMSNEFSLVEVTGDAVHVDVVSYYAKRVMGQGLPAGDNA